MQDKLYIVNLFSQTLNHVQSKDDIKISGKLGNFVSEVHHANATWCDFPWNLPNNAGKKNSIVSCHRYLTQCNPMLQLEWFKKCAAAYASPENLRDTLLRRNVSRCNLPATCLAMLLQLKLQGELYRVALALLCQYLLQF